ncbi:hypothetical protein F4809DRAFT_618129 [Biscogniauxia mediterranea]|nr:hypothetical protein F4809DRAFT_618129 [Biscogniauxia mediterranea]
MFFPTLFTTTAITITACSAAAVLPPRAPGESTSNTFRLSVNVTRFDLTPSLQGQQVGYATTTTGDDCLADLVLASSPGAIFYQTGDPSTVHLAGGPNAGAGVVVTPGGTATVPSLNTVQLQCGNASAGVAVVAPDPSSSTVDLQFGGAGSGWMACPLADGAVVLRFRSAGQRTIAGCADVQLLPVCEEAAAEPAPPQDSVATTCYTGL